MDDTPARCQVDATRSTPRGLHRAARIGSRHRRVPERRPAPTRSPREAGRRRPARPRASSDGGSITMSVSVTARAHGAAIVDLELHNASSRRVFQHYWLNASFKRGQRRTFNASWTVPANTPVGAYTVNVGIFEPGWGEVWHWNNRADRIQVTAACHDYDHAGTDHHEAPSHHRSRTDHHETPDHHHVSPGHDRSRPPRPPPPPPRRRRAGRSLSISSREGSSARTGY